VGTYAWAAIVRDEFGLAFLPFMFLTLPWSLLVYPLAQQVPRHAFAAAIYAVLCTLLSGVNAVALYLLVARASALLRRAVHHLRT